MAAPIYNPVIPCIHPIPNGMYPGRMIRVQGSLPPGAQRFAINLQCGPNTDPRDDIALHLNFRFVEMCVVRNHLTAMAWGNEDTSGGMPLTRGEAFEALILCEPNSMKIALNGMHFCEFPHRLPYQRISHLTVDGDVMVQFIGFEGAQAPPQNQMYMQQPAYGTYGAAPPAYGAPGYGAPQGYGQPPSPPMQGFFQGPRGRGMRPGVPMGYAQGQQYVQGQPRSRGMGTGAAVGLAAAGVAAGGLAGYAAAGGFGGSSSPEQGQQVSPPGQPPNANPETPGQDANVDPGQTYQQVQPPGQTQEIPSDYEHYDDEGMEAHDGYDYGGDDGDFDYGD